MGEYLCPECNAESIDTDETMPTGEKLYECPECTAMWYMMKVQF